ncbi:Tol-Pal system protein TolB [Paraconexibacter sp. AEG42_29]|uniref:Tol-Pal system protein TolB n=1 Tax=Paraconexibacter sp. AEG42_29 TaxID=2997339 RepID=A0AAU7B052_9ACTN
MIRSLAIRCCALGLAATGAACAAAPAHAAFPGANGAIVFSGTQDGDSDIYALPLDGSPPRNITNTTLREQQPSVSPDGTRVAYKTAVTSPRDEESWTSGFDGTGARRVTDTTGALRFSTQPGWSPDGTRLLVRSNRDAGNYDVWSVRATDGGDPVQLTADAADDRYPAYSPDGRRVAFRSDRAGDPDIWVMNADGSSPVNLTAGTGRWESAPAWSPDGTRIAFERVSVPGDPDVDPAAAAADEIWTMAADGSGQRRLTDNAFHDEGPAWSPDGTQIVFTSGREEPKGDIWLMDSDGARQRLLYGSPAVEESPDWQALPVPPPVAVPPPPAPPVVDPVPPVMEPKPPRPPRDTDGDGLSDVRERAIRTSPTDADSDEDGLPDGAERATSPKNRDSDGDGIADGVELGVVTPARGTNRTRWRPDRDPRTRTDPARRDTDRDGRIDGREDRNHNGRVDRGETDPRRRNTFRKPARRG